MTAYNWPSFYGDPSWFVQDRLGMFIHWGLYSSAARHEWVMNRESIHPDTYRKYFDHFDPDLYDPAVWARSAREAGMKYVVLTAKHHEGFCLWDSKLTDYTVTHTAYGQDALRLFVDAFRAEGLKVGLYYSLIDWHHPDFPVDGLHPLRDDKAAREANGARDIARYRAYMLGQVRELLTEYGTIDYLWFDFSYTYMKWDWASGKGKDDWGSEELERMILELQPNILLNDRLELDRGVITPEQYQPDKALVKDGKLVVWEACQTLNGSWGYDRDNLDWKPVPMLVEMLVDTVSKGGNLLLNVGPNARGELDSRSLDSLCGIGGWTRVHGRSVYGAGPSGFRAPNGCRYTQNGSRLYLHLFEWPFKHIHLDGLQGKVAYAQFLHDASEVRMTEAPVHTQASLDSERPEPGRLTLSLPIQRPGVAVPVIELFLKK
ncbi:alpha-L-fucosidase [Paenibacillus sp. MBLB4367]|uniref:alpha-L-fucosidase n=1 Tax=Paenibacillus sp. MBLB4367 TaxID=3384767 RepID=UPI003907E953